MPIHNHPIFLTSLTFLLFLIPITLSGCTNTSKAPNTPITTQSPPTTSEATTGITTEEPTTSPPEPTTTKQPQPDPDPKESPITVAIDPGHQAQGNSDTEPIGPGASSSKAKVASGTEGINSGTPEYEINLSVSLKLKDELESRGYQVVMIRETNDVDISNAERAKVANESGAEIFLRIHSNGDASSEAKGALTMCPTSDNPFCSDIAKPSKRLSVLVLDGMCDATGAKRRSIIETDTMSGINWCTIPVTIVEMGFLTNEEEDRQLNDQDYQIKMANGIANGVDKYFDRSDK